MSQRKGNPSSDRLVDSLECQPDAFGHEGQGCASSADLRDRTWSSSGSILREVGCSRGRIGLRRDNSSCGIWSVSLATSWTIVCDSCQSSEGSRFVLLTTQWWAG